jgi:hypothetical protein
VEIYNFYLWEVQKGTSILHREMPSKQKAITGSENIPIKLHGVSGKY